jgi:protein-disulfide isomerase
MGMRSASLLTYAPALVLPVSARDHIRGRLDAAHVLVEYGDYECPYCRAAQPEVEAVLGAMGEDLAFVFRHFPLSNIHPQAWKAAEAAEAAAAQGSFWEYHSMLFENQEALAIPHLVTYAGALGLDVHGFAEGLAAGIHGSKVHEDFRSGILSGVNGTPSFFVNGLRHDGGNDAASLLRAMRG